MLKHVLVHLNYIIIETSHHSDPTSGFLQRQGVTRLMDTEVLRFGMPSWLILYPINDVL